MILADAHVHIYDCFDLPTFFNSAIENFKKEASCLTHNPVFTAVLFLTESQRENKFFELKKKNDHIKGWSMLNTEENYSMYLRSGDGQAVFLIAGRQIVAEENLEVLALGTDKVIEDGLSFASTIEQVLAEGAVPVIPWGAGKWIGKRGRILESYLRNISGTGLFLGDNGGRPFFWKNVLHFKLALDKGISILPGSDPLPFPDQCRKPGSFGFSMNGSISRESPFQDIKNLLYNTESSINSFGLPEAALGFIFNQVRMQIRKHISGSLKK